MVLAESFPVAPVATRVVVAGTSETKPETETWVAETKTETEAN